MANEKNYVKFFTGTDVMNSYLSDVRKFDVLTAEEEKKLFERYHNGDMSARDEIILKNQLYVYHWAKIYAEDSEDIMDYVQVGNIGLMEAVDAFDVTRGLKFITCAVWYIRRSMNYYMANDHNSVVKSNNMKYGKKIEKIKNDFFKKECRFPTHEEIVDILHDKYNLEVNDIRDVYDLSVNSISVNLDDDYTVEDSADFALATAYYNDADNDENEMDENTKLSRILDYLPTKDSDILKKYYGIGGEAYSIAELAEEYGMYESDMEKLISTEIRVIQDNLDEIFPEMNKAE